MQMHKTKRVEIIIEAPIEPRLTKALGAGGVFVFTVLPVFGGSGRSGRWSQKGQVSRAGGMVAVVCLIRPDRLDGVPEAAFSIVERQIGVMTGTDAEVIPADRFQEEPSGRRYFRGSPRVIDHAS